MPIDPRLVGWDDEPPAAAAATIDPRLVGWDEPAAPKDAPFVAGGLKGAAGGVLRGIGDTFMGGWQLGARGLEAVMPAGSAAERLVQRGRKGLESWNQAAEDDYRKNWRDGQDPGFDVARLVGNIGATAPVAAALPGAGLSLLARTGIGGVSGAGFGALQPVAEGDGDYWSQKAKQVGIGAAGGAVAAPITAGLSRMLSPRSSDAVRALRAEGVKLTPGQTAGGAMRTAEEKAMSLPLLGTQIRNAAERGNESLNRAAINRSLFQIGERLPKGMVGHEAINYADDALSGAYRKVVDKIGAAPVDDALLSDLGKLQAMVANQPKEMVERLGRIIDNEILTRTQYGRIPGEAIKKAESNLGQIARGLRRSGDYDTRVLGDAVFEAQRSMREWLGRVAPSGVADELKRVNTGWANFLRVQRAASSVAAPDGVFTPAQLHSAVKALDPSKGKSAFARGDALMQDLSGAAKGAMGSKVPNSGTADRALPAYLLAQGVNPLAWPKLAAEVGGLGALSIPYMPGIRQATNWALAGRQGPAWGAAGQGLLTLSPALGAALGPGVAGLLHPSTQ